MFENRPLTPAEGRLRHPTGSENLVEHPAEWYSLIAGDGARLTLGSAFVTLAGPDLLSHFDKLGAGGGTLDFALELADRFGAVHDVTSVTVHALEQASEWRRGEHHGTTMAPDAGVLADGSSRAGMRGGDLLPSQPPPTGVYWISAPVVFRNGREVEGLFWEVDDLRKPSGEAMGAFKISVRFGQSAAGGEMNWRPWRAVTAAAEPARRSYRFDEPAPSADAVQWRVDLKYGPGGAGHAEGRLRTPTVLLLGTRIRLESRRLHFESLGDLVSHADERILLQPGGWNGTDDVAIVRITLGIPLSSSPMEAVRVKLAGGGVPPSVTYVRVQCTGGILFEDAG